MKIGIFGCSYVSGVWPKNYNLAAVIADKCPQHKVYDYSMGGHSMQMINYLFQKFKHNHDFNMVKVTSPGRLSFFSEFDFENNREWTTDNFNTWSSIGDYYKKIVRMNYTSMPRTLAPEYNIKSIKKLHKLYYSHINTDIAIAETFAITNYLQTHANYVWRHRRHYNEDISNGCVLTSQILPNYKSYLMDTGGHLNQEGINLEADWLISNVLSKKYIDN